MSKRKKLNDDNLTQAMEAVKSKTLSIRAAAEAYDINRESLRRRVAKGEVGKGAGRPNVLPDDVEQKLVGYIIIIISNVYSAHIYNIYYIII